jgi:hypothetical protein
MVDAGAWLLLKRFRVSGFGCQVSGVSRWEAQNVVNTITDAVAMELIAV